MRTGLLARALLDRGHEVVWWKSTFEHVSKTHYRTTDGFEEAEPGLTIGWIHSRGYRGHVSLARLVDHRELGVGFARSAPGRPVPDIVVSSLPIPELALAGVEFGGQHGVPVVVDIRDWWPDALAFTLPRWLRPLMKPLLAPYSRLVRRACRGATAITGITPAFVDWGLARAGRARSALDRDFPHGYEVPTASSADVLAARRYWDGLGVFGDGSTFNVVFVGSVSRTFDFSRILTAARTLASSRPPVVFVLCGDGDRLAAVRAEAQGIRNVVFTSTWVGSSEIQELLQRASVGLVPLPNRPDFLATINNKTVEYLSAGVPIIVSPENSWVGRLASEFGFGVSWNGSDTCALSAIVREFAACPAVLKGMSSRAHEYFERTHVAASVYSRFAEFLEDLTRQKQCRIG